tara:strand:+ start:104 stop:511 length:408 start_codon:yes stop_codon:yes gene_type:complete
MGQSEVLEIVYRAAGNSTNCAVCKKALMFACRRGHDSVARVMIEEGANIDQTDKDGFTALMLACKNGHDNVALRLIEAKAKLDKVGPQEYTALMFACSHGHAQCALQLINAGANVDRANVYVDTFVRLFLPSTQK